MKIPRLLLAVCVLYLGLIPSVFAMERMIWEDCIREAAQHNPDLAAAQEAVRKSQAQSKGAYGPLLPQLSANAGYADAKSGGRSQQYSAGLSVKQSLFSGFKNEAGVQKGKADLEAAAANLSVVKAQVSSDLKAAFAQLLFAQEQAQLVETIASRRQENVRLVELRFEGGREPKGAYLRSRALYRQADYEVSQADRALKVSQRQLARVLGRRETDRIVVQGLQTALPGSPPDFEALALQTPVRLEAVAQAQAAAAGVKVARSELFPDVSATGSLGRRGEKWPPGQDEWSAGVVLSYPFWPGGQNFFDVQSANAEERRLRESLRSTEDQTVLNLEQTFAAYQDAVQRVGVEQEFLEAAQARAKIARGQYTLGLLSFQDWDTIENDLISNQKIMLTSLRDALVAEASWERVQGKGAIL